MSVRAAMLVVGAGSVLLTGCLSLQAYEGPKQPGSEVARVRGDTRFRSGAPLNLILRSIDERPLDARYSAVDVLPGRHRLLVDCEIAEYASVSRHALEVDLDAGRSYALRADTGPGNRDCVGVRLEVVK